MRFAETFESHGEEEANSLLLCGQVGAGKTHLGAACSMQLMGRGIPVVYMGYRDEMTSLKSKIIDEKAYSDTVNRFKTAKVLFIDDFIKGKTTESDVNIVYEIVNYRYNNHLPMIVSTEKLLEDLIVFDEAIGSRLIEMCRGYIVVFEGKKLNYRLYKGAL
jgi:DNA replication protein DnaC